MACPVLWRWGVVKVHVSCLPATAIVDSLLLLLTYARTVLVIGNAHVNSRFNNMQISLGHYVTEIVPFTAPTIRLPPSTALPCAGRTITHLHLRLHMYASTVTRVCGSSPEQGDLERGHFGCVK